MNSFKITKLYFNFLLLTIIFISLGGFSTSANAVTAGCDPAKYETMKQIAKVRTAYDVGVTEEIIPKPDSVLTLSCFEQAAMIAAERGGSIFSDDFRDNLRNVIQGVTNNMAGNFVGGLMDRLGINYNPNWAGGNFTCDNMLRVWEDAQNSGVNNNAAFLSLDEILNVATGGSPPALPVSANILIDNLRTVATEANRVATALGMSAVVIPQMNTDTNANGYLDICDVMTNLNGGTPPNGC